jgi:hypothetical protein
MFFPRYFLDGVPVLGDVPIFHPEQIIKRAVNIGEQALTDGKDKCAFGQHAVDAVIFHPYPSGGHGLQSGAQSAQTGGDGGVVWYLSLGVYNRRRCGISGLDTLEQINYLLFFCVHVSLLDLFVAMLYRLNFVTAFVTI